MKKYTVIHKDGSKEIINAQCAVKDAMAEGNIVLDEDFDVVNPVLLTPECDNKFALLYGRKHSVETIEKLRTINKHRVGKNNPTSRKIYADGLVFDSATECAKHFGKCVSTITHRAKSPNYPNFYYL